MVDFPMKISKEKEKKVNYREKYQAIKLNYIQVNAEQLSKIDALEKSLKLEQERNEQLQLQFPRLEQKTTDYTDKMYRLVNKITELETREKLRLQHLQVEKQYQEKEIQHLTSNLMDQQKKMAHLKTIKTKCKIEIKELQVQVKVSPLRKNTIVQYYRL